MVFTTDHSKVLVSDVVFDYVPPPKGRGAYCFGADPVDIIFMVTAGLKLPKLSSKCACLHNISQTIWGILNQICMDITLGHSEELIRF